MPAIVWVHVVKARNLPVMDKSHNTTDALVEVKFGSNVQKSSTQPRTLSPEWDEKFEFHLANDLNLQDDWLQLKVCDADMFRKGETIGDVLIDISVLLQRDASFSHKISGWFPISNSRKGLRGQLFVTITIEFLADTSKYAESSTGVMFFRLPLCPPGYRIKTLKGFVEELVTIDDPDFHFQARVGLRSTAKSNEMRTDSLYECTAKLKRLIGRRALDMEGNAVIGMCVHFDLEEDSGIVCRGYGTCCVLKRHTKFSAIDTPAFQKLSPTLLLQPALPAPPPLELDTNNQHTPGSSEQHHLKLSLPSSSSPPTQASPQISPFPSPPLLPSSSPPPLSPSRIVNQMASFYTQYPTTEKSAQVTLQSPPTITATPATTIASTPTISDLDPFSPTLTPTNTAHQPTPFTTAPTNTTIPTTSPPLLPALGTTPPSPHMVHMTTQQINTTENERLDTADNPTNVVGTSHQGGEGGLPSLFSMNARDHIRLLTLRAFPSRYAVKFATVVSARSVKRLPEQNVRRKLIEEMHDSWWDELRREVLKHCKEASATHVAGYTETCTINANEDFCILSAMGTAVTLDKSTNDELSACECCHLPKQDTTGEEKISHICGVCRSHQVPEIILSTTEPPANVTTVGTGVRIEARVMKYKRAESREKPEVIVSELLPFIESELHRQLLLKLRVAQRNAAFGLSIQISISDDRILAVATATALLLKPLPKPTPLNVPPALSHGGTRTRDTLDYAKRAQSKSKANFSALTRARHFTMHVPLLGDRHNTGGGGGGGGGGNAPSIAQSAASTTTSTTVTTASPAVQSSGVVGTGNIGAHSPNNTPPHVNNLAAVVAGNAAETLLPEEPNVEYCTTVIEVEDDFPSLLAVDRDPAIPPDCHMSNLLSVASHMRDLEPLFHLITLVKRVVVPEEIDIKNPVEYMKFLADIYQDIFHTIFFRLRKFLPVTLQNLHIQIDDEDDTMQFVATAAVVDSKRRRDLQQRPEPYDSVVLTPLASVDADVLAPLGLVHVHLVREASDDGESLTGFSQTVLIEAQIMLRSKVGAMGGNLVLGFSIDQFKQEDTNGHYALVSISGDAYRVKFRTNKNNNEGGVV